MSIEMITGPMFCGKTSELIRRIRVIRRAGQSAVIFKPTLDNRYSTDCVVTHYQDEEKCIAISSAKEILSHLNDSSVAVGIDEAQFFDETLIDTVEYLQDRNFRVIIAGLDMDFRKKPFGVISTLMGISDNVIKLKAVCSKCGAPAMYSKRLAVNKERIVIGTRQYEARCRNCYEN